MSENNKSVSSEMINGKSYPAILIDVVADCDPIRKVYVVKFIYKVYFSATQTKEVVDNFYLWDHAAYRRVSMERLDKVLNAYNLSLIFKDYRNEMTITNACKWLIGTKVELQQYCYKGNKYKVIFTERNNSYRVDDLWKCMLKNDLDSFPECLKSKEELLDNFVSECLKSENLEINLNEDFCVTPEMYQELEFNNKKKGL